jgi:hypothetical protein
MESHYHCGVIRKGHESLLLNFSDELAPQTRYL